MPRLSRVNCTALASARNSFWRLIAALMKPAQGADPADDQQAETEYGQRGAAFAALAVLRPTP
jgi:hypothetical protein